MAACIVLMIACFSPWTYHDDLHKTFTGFFTEKNMYGKPGKFLFFFSVLSTTLILIPKLWAKRTHILLSAFMLGYAIKTYILFTSCYNAYCPEKKYGIYLMMISCIVILLVSILPDMRAPKTFPKEVPANSPSRSL